jgi:prevent-host-death family protein
MIVQGRDWIRTGEAVDGREHAEHPAQVDEDWSGLVNIRTMSMVFNVQEAKASLSRLLVAAERGEDVVIARYGKPVARLVPVAAQTKRELGFLPGQVSDEVARPLDDAELAAWE